MKILTRKLMLKRRAFDLYYSLLNCVTRPSGSCAQIRLRANGQLQFKRTSGKFGGSDVPILTVPWVSADDYFIFHLTLASQVQKREYLYAQAVMMFDDAWQRRFVRIFNFRFILVDSARRYQSPDKLYGSLNSVGLFFDLFRTTLDQLRSKSSDSLRQILINQFKDIISHFRLTEVSAGDHSIAKTL